MALHRLRHRRVVLCSWWWCSHAGRARSTPGGSPAPTPESTPGGIFGGDGGTTKPRTALSNPATSPLNLIGKIEGWGIGPATKVAEVSIKVSAATGAQLKELLKAARRHDLRAEP